MILLRGVTKCYGKNVVLDDITIVVRPGEILGLWGPNGVGKTTLIQMMIGTLRPDAGTVDILGHDPYKEWVAKRAMGIVEEDSQGFSDLTISEFLWWVGRIRGVPDEVCQEQIEQCCRDFSIWERTEDILRTLSHGMRRKALIISAFIGDPKAMLMDEPTNGLDIGSLQVLSRMLKEARDQGRCAVIACHDLGFMKHNCTSVLQMDGGQYQLTSPDEISLAFD